MDMAGKREATEGESPEFAQLVSKLKMEDYRRKKLTLQDVLNIGQESMNDIELRTVENIPWYFLQNVMALNVNARNTKLKQSAQRGGKRSQHRYQYQSFTDFLKPDLSDSVHPLDVLCVLLNCSDHFLQQEIITKMSMCQFAVPLLLPAGNGSNCTFMLWTMRDIVKKWTPRSCDDSKSSMGDRLVNIHMPTFSFMRLGKCTFSKSKFLNHVLSPDHTNYNFFVNQDMDCGNYPRKVSDGLVEISWFFPGGQGNHDIFPKPFAVTNLRGDLKSNWRQFTFLTQISTAVFIFIESFAEKDYRLFSQFRDTDTNYYFILSPNYDEQNAEETAKVLKQLNETLKISLVKNWDKHVMNLVSDIRLIIADFIEDRGKTLSLENMAFLASEHRIKLDESLMECQNARKHALSIISKIKDVVQYKKKTMQLQGDLWKEISKVQKEICRLKNQGTSASDGYKNNLTDKCSELTRTQYQNSMPDGIKTFIQSITKFTYTEKVYFMKWMRFYLDSFTQNYAFLQPKNKSNGIKTPKKIQLEQLCQNISDSSLGIEHFLREMGQFYEAECSMIKQKQISPNQRQHSHLPGIAADLLLEGFLLELIDGDASNIPLQWITDVLTELDTKTGGQCRMIVISVLGVQSTGKSTLLNTMFGLQFPVGSGRCTRGAFIALVKVKENVREELDCDFILAIDTEGLKAPELSSLENSYEHDNELAMLVFGLSDITIINTSMENMAEMKDILQIVVRAFLRMNEDRNKRNCHFVHQNVSHVTTYDNEVGRAKLLKELNEMTKAAVEMERRDKAMEFSDIIDYDPERYTWYIPGLWHGVPPMASINQGYSENVFKLKKHLFRFIKERQFPEPQNIDTFIERMKSLWNTVKHETLIFSFQNILEVEAYNQLFMKYSELEWNFRQKVHTELSKYDNIIKRNIDDNLYTLSDFEENYLKTLLDQEEVNMTQELSEFFKSSCASVLLLERNREDFLNRVKSLRKDLGDIASKKCSKTIQIQNVKNGILHTQDKCQQQIEKMLHEHLENNRMKQCVLNEMGMKLQFDALWNDILFKLKVSRLMYHRIDMEMLEQLKREMINRPGNVTQKLHNIRFLKVYGEKQFEITKGYIDLTGSSIKRVKELFFNNSCRKLKITAQSLADNCAEYVLNKVKTKDDYNEMYCQELLTMINEKLEEKKVTKHHPTALFEVDLKLHILGKAAPHFQKMHEDFSVCMRVCLSQVSFRVSHPELEFQSESPN
ncbi:up-regulator of cell proliferation-like [Pelobates cultripes]|uniref:Up-regulator of cell proliferation-like n=1 Tax=Pelobates cultripes TaxID=61616 RepID=A0AAD1WER2_PELCU|nr:up-regulator of cell proliferation-like [Pelobates cultripes]